MSIEPQLCETTAFHLFQANVPVLCPLKTSENQKFSDIFKGKGGIEIEH